MTKRAGDEAGSIPRFEPMDTPYVGLPHGADDFTDGELGSILRQRMHRRGAQQDAAYRRFLGKHSSGRASSQGRFGFLKRKRNVNHRGSIHSFPRPKRGILRRNNAPYTRPGRFISNQGRNRRVKFVLPLYDARGKPNFRRR